MRPPPPDNPRAHRARTDRNLLLGFFALLFIVGGGLIWVFYGAGAAALGVACIALGAILTGLLALLMAGLQWLSDRLEEQ
jgi:apolipoprotein N-acyltransferase